MAEPQLVFGIHSVQSLLKTNAQRIHEIWVQRGREDQRVQKLLDLARREGISCKLVNRKGLDEVADGNHQGILAYCDPCEIHDEGFLMKLLDNLAHPPFLLILDGVTDPHNLGACMRSAEAAGIDAVIAPKDRSVGLNATARKVACGAAEVLPFIAVTNLSRTMKQLQSKGIWTVGAAGEGSGTVYDVDLTGALALVMGAEGSGLRRLTREHCDTVASIPMLGTVSSLNVSVASGVFLFEAVRQRSGNTVRVK